MVKCIVCLVYCVQLVFLITSHFWTYFLLIIHLQYRGLQFVIVLKSTLKQNLSILICLIINSIGERCVILNVWWPLHTHSNKENTIIANSLLNESYTPLHSQCYVTLKAECTGHSSVLVVTAFILFFFLIFMEPCIVVWLVAITNEMQLSKGIYYSTVH